MFLGDPKSFPISDIQGVYRINHIERDRERERKASSGEKLYLR